MNVIRALIKGMEPAIRARRAILGPRLPSWTVELETIAELMRRTASFSAIAPISVQRRVIETRRRSTRAVRATELTRVDAAGVGAEWISAADSDHDRVFLYLHGGGYAIGSIKSHRDLLGRLCLASGMRILAVDYRLAPEHPFPAQLEDALCAYRWLRDVEGVAPGRIVIGGESAGAALTLSTLVALRDAGELLPAGAVSISGWLDLNSRRTSMQSNSQYDFISRATVRAMARRFAPRSEHANPLASPVHADLTGLPPLLIQVGAAETLLDDSLRVAESAREAGVDVSLEVWPDMIHAWHVFAPLVEEGRRAITRIGEFAIEHTRDMP